MEFHRGSQGRPKDNGRYVVATSTDNLYKGGSTYGLEERRSRTLQKLAWHHAPVCPEQDTYPHHP